MPTDKATELAREIVVRFATLTGTNDIEIQNSIDELVVQVAALLRTQP